MKESVVQRNALARQKLKSLAEKLTAEELCRPAGKWTPAALLAHLAFWDRRALILLRKWQSSEVGPSAADVDVLNEAMREFFIALPPDKAVEFAVAAAEEIDSEIEALSAEFYERVETDGKAVHLDRAKHRLYHMAQIEAALLR